MVGARNRHCNPYLEGIDETPEFVAFIGATDTAAAESFLRKLISFCRRIQRNRIRRRSHPRLPHLRS